jgi:hypothetical protein
MPTYDPLYVAARRVLLDVLEALGPHRAATTVVGAHAVYLRTGATIAGVAPFTTDADLALAPGDLSDEPLIEAVLQEAGFRQEREPGQWLTTIRVGDADVDVPVDIMVPAGLAPEGGRRSARLPPHGKLVARKAAGLEGTVIDHDRMLVTALADDDHRGFTVHVAGPAALMVAKVHKLQDRLAQQHVERIADKDAADLYRLMQAVPVNEIADRFASLLHHEIARDPSHVALDGLQRLFGTRGGQGIRMAIRALRMGVPEGRVTAVCTGFVRSLTDAMADLGRSELPVFEVPPDAGPLTDEQVQQALDDP